jgi:glucosamine--fructose-6-phosphate aminotransferase (isomerizing)
MKHGPIALITPGLPVVTIAPRDHLLEKVLSNIEEVKARHGQVIAITDDASSLAPRADHLIMIPASHAAFFPFVAAVPLQLLAYHIGVLLGCDVDQPRNLAKSVTVE